ncbi:MAG: hypothetical protein IPJ48_08670 [Propionivibrio sp.]|uniref:Uncharacterized protein n=1 Tax=Candidatus Propionivibrio dominans TaxID=2954373 RepID=A0A9D7I8I1_9RHOO|nr:hypothetical protein [Candidatus Propionivibrio dominans]
MTAVSGLNGFLLKEKEAKAFERESAGPGSTTRKFFFSKTEPGCDTLLHAFQKGKYVLETHRYSGAGRNQICTSGQDVSKTVLMNE